MVSRRRAWWVDACVVSFACWLLQGVSVDYSARFFHHAALSGDASLVHAHAGLLLGVALLGGDRRVLATAFFTSFLHWWWRARLQDPPESYVAGFAVAMVLQWRWTELCARWAGGPFRGGRRLKVSGMFRYAVAGLFLFPTGWTLLSAAVAWTHGEPFAAVANTSAQLWLAKHVGVGAVTLPFLLLWTDDWLRRAMRRRWVAVVTWLCASVLAAHVLQAWPSWRWVELVYDYRALAGVLLGIAMLLWRVEYSMPLLTSMHLILLHGLTDQAGQAASPSQVMGLLAHLVECNFMVLILAVLFLLNRERKHRYHHLRAMCRHDASSGLDNAHALREAWRTSPTRPAVLGFLLLDQVERVLGSYGWRAQSQLLREIGREMVPLARPYHMGGGKFVLLPLGAEQAGASAGKMEEILRRLQAFVFQWHGAQLRVSPYLGVAPCDRAGVEALDECLANACDAALRAREVGEHNPVPCEPSPLGRPDAQARRHRLVAAAEALACVHAGRVELYVQPIVALAGQPSAGFQGEVLCRLRTAQGSLLLPNEFIADLEAGGHASELDIAVIECLFQWLRTHPLAIPRIARLGINLSGKSVASASFRARFAELLRQAPLPHAALCFELTETAVIASQEPVLRLFHDLRARGCSLSLDDFGSGMQNFERLRQVPVDSLKIDGQFVRNMQSQSRDLEIVRAAVAVAKAHGLATVAEYVETAELADQLRDLGVQWGQGYHFGHPVPIGTRLLPDVAPVACS
ncbi:EAL domain-containing protein (putative c-di-GMP-specific phosphodiesterase class I) [Pseudoxanthomonas sp. 3HH-4]|uniref:EAL domain-containing protein n=1 Tax=Pseudoxanthomonas sp. 3HH-4 TaxID=1690214 RepID=UPI0011518742|nr:EAL domain-containing protein [Pseudoxanthomonas sp. 3HH-4]TQM06800.1 EAL domain-containing protein (putative c-di-GMP-specific phosphodiesterase class I) [Pseudoxanthomonas sp. 3HH-4]